MGMTDNQFKAYRRKELKEYREMLDIAINTNADAVLIKKLQLAVEEAQADIEA